MTTPRATARLQFHKGFRFADAVPVLGYYAQLGVSHIYASPILKSKPGSMHGYDIVDHAEINPELGGEPAFRRFVAALRALDLGLIVDIVPNHMCVSDNANRWWNDVLEWGPDSAYAGFFDIEWHSKDASLRNKVHLPFLGKPYGEVLKAGELSLHVAPDTGRLSVAYYDRLFPLNPRSHEDLAGDFAKAFDTREPEGRANLHRLLERQYYRLAWWRTAADEINWRRFFDITDLAGLKVERPDVFEQTHALIFKLYAEGLIDGVRIDHVDGLADPRTYCRRLRRVLDDLSAHRPAAAPNGRPYIIVEKILGASERLQTDWLVDGTTGYDFMDQAAGVLHDARGETPLTTLWTELTGRRPDFRAVAETAKRLILDENLHSERDKTADALHRLARNDPATRDYTLPALRHALTEVLVNFPVYRSYATVDGRVPSDGPLFEAAMEQARQIIPETDHHILTLIDDWLGAKPVAGRAARALQRRAIASFQQLTSALTAKSIEDTAFYRYGRLISRNEVGSSPADFSLSRDAFHAACAERSRNFPYAMLATATHDHKRGEDTRMRIATLSEIPDTWGEAVRHWMRLNAPFRASLPDGVAPEPADELMLYQTLIGAWPVDADATDQAALATFRDRILAWQTKAIREAKRRSRWIAPDQGYEDAAQDFTRAILDNERSSAFLGELARFVRAIAPAAALNGLTQTLLRLTAPGVPDLYQGTEFWDFSLVDPDNRRPVDYQRRIASLAGTHDLPALLHDWPDGRIKQALIHRLLSLRERYRDVLADGVYEPLALEGEAAENVIAFTRGDRIGDHAVVIASRYSLRRLGDDNVPLIPASAWGGTTLLLPSPADRTCNLLTGETHAGDGRIDIAQILSQLPVAVLWRERSGA